MEHLRIANAINSTATSLDDTLIFQNNEKTAELMALPKYKLFNQWLEDNGAKHPLVDYPVAFGKEG